MFEATKDRQEACKALAEIGGQLSILHDMTVAQLRDRYFEVFEEPTRSRNKDYLRKKIAWRIQELAEGGLSKRAKDQIEKLAADAPARWRNPGEALKIIPSVEETKRERDPRLPKPGETITRMYKGTGYEVTILEDGFQYLGKTYPSLSKIARKITGTNWNGFLFFGLTKQTKSQKEKVAL